jgi:hypothetical protein
MNDDAARETVEHLQNAAVEMIRATRAFLDLLEDIVEEAGPLLPLVADLATKGRSAARRDEPGAAAASPPVEHIRVS